MLHDSIYIKFWKRQNSRTYQWLPEAGGKERVLPQGGVFRVMEWFSILSMVVIHMTCFCQNLQIGTTRKVFLQFLSCQHTVSILYFKCSPFNPFFWNWGHFIMLKSVSKLYFNKLIIIIKNTFVNQTPSSHTIFHPSTACQLFICLYRKDLLNGSKVYKTQSSLLVCALHFFRSSRTHFPVDVLYSESS